MEAGQESTLEEIFNELIEMGMSPEDAAIKAREIYNNMDMSSSQKGIGNLAMADPMLVEQYQQYVFEMEEQGLQPMSFEEFVAQARAGMNEGGIADITFSRVQPSKDGSRPGYRTRAVVESQQRSYNRPSKSQDGPPGGGDPGMT